MSQKTPLERALQEAGLVRVVQALKAAFPSARFVLNRGFEILPVVRDAVAAVAAESIYQGWDPATKGYREVPAADRDALVPLLARVRDEYQLPVIAIDYVAPEEPALARTTAARIFALGFIPYVSNRALDIVGVGAVAAANDDARGTGMLHSPHRGDSRWS